MLKFQITKKHNGKLNTYQTWTRCSICWKMATPKIKLGGERKILITTDQFNEWTNALKGTTSETKKFSFVFFQVKFHIVSSRKRKSSLEAALTFQKSTPIFASRETLRKYTVQRDCTQAASS